MIVIFSDHTHLLCLCLVLVYLRYSPICVLFSFTIISLTRRALVALIYLHSSYYMDVSFLSSVCLIRVLCAKVLAFLVILCTKLSNKHCSIN